ncbi:MAG: hypothetical protein HY897_21975 [Deltaproteobacteria bacterium]|nr:hypothetical protein [Deltaproteobacteria bacterium]
METPKDKSNGKTGDKIEGAKRDAPAQDGRAEADSPCRSERGVRGGSSRSDPRFDDAAHGEFFSQGDKGHISDDAELADSIKKRPPSRRNPIVMAFVALFSLYLMWDMRADFLYFFRWPTPRELGSVEDLSRKEMRDNLYVVVRGIPDPRKAQIELTNMGIMSSFYLYFPYLGNTNLIAREKIREVDRLAQAPNADYNTAPRVGRLYSFAKFPRKAELDGVRKYFKEKFDRQFGDDSFVLVIGEKPWSDIHYPLLYLVLAAFVSWNGWQLYRRFR